jgi:hypothetical protein
VRFLPQDSITCLPIGLFTRSIHPKLGRLNLRRPNWQEMVTHLCGVCVLQKCVLIFFSMRYTLSGIDHYSCFYCLGLRHIICLYRIVHVRYYPLFLWDFNRMIEVFHQNVMNKKKIAYKFKLQNMFLFCLKRKVAAHIIVKSP